MLVWAFDRAVRNENEISSIPADYALRHVQTKQSSGINQCFHLISQPE
jgi:hypothetical protein